MNFITAIFSNFSDSEKAALGDLAATLEPEWEAGDAETRFSLEIQFTEALNNYRVSQS